MIAEYLTMSVDDAFLLLRRYTRERNRKLTEVATDIVNREITSQALTIRPGPRS